MENKKYPGYFISFEGPEGCGKSTVSRQLHDYLVNNLSLSEDRVVLTREPGGTLISGAIRELIFIEDFETDMKDETRLLLFLAARAQHSRQLLKPALTGGKVVLCDRFADSSIAYQGYALKLGCGRVDELNNYATDNIIPDLTFFLDIPVEVGLERKRKQGEWNLLDRMPLQKHVDLAYAYKIMAENDITGRWETVNAHRQLSEVFIDVKSIVEMRLAGAGILEGRNSRVEYCR
jgi:dTMP kinase